MEKMSGPFEFKQCTGLLKATGLRATTLRELRDSLAVVSDESIFHHVYEYFLNVHVMEYTNDFARWAGEGLGERTLAEHLSNIDPYTFSTSTELRLELLKVIDEYLDHFPEPRPAMPGTEFYLNETITIVYPLGIRAKNLAEFLIAVKYVDQTSIYYHFYEARVRLGADSNDFSTWIAGVLGKEDLAARIGSIDPFMHDIEGIRGHIVGTVEEEVRLDMASGEAAHA